MSDFPALVHFYEGWADHHEVSSDGFPVFQNTVMIQIERPPLLKLNREANRDDFLTYPEEYEAFKTIHRGREAGVSEQGYPLVMWPVLTPADIQIFAARGIYTVEALAKLAGRRDMPPALSELALRAERMMDMQQNFGKYDIMLAERDAQLKEVVEQLKEARSTISAQNAMIDTLKMRVA
jgi:hypothetical protein